MSGTSCQVEAGWQQSQLSPLPVRHGNNALGFRRHITHIPYGSSIRVFAANPEFQLKGNIIEPAVALPCLGWCQMILIIHSPAAPPCHHTIAPIQHILHPSLTRAGHYVLTALHDPSTDTGMIQHMVQVPILTFLLQAAHAVVWVCSQSNDENT